MCVSNSDKSKIDLLRPSNDIPIGTRVNLTGQEIEFTETGFINPKSMKKFLDLLTTDEQGQACFDKLTMGCQGKNLEKNLPNGTIS